MKSLVLLLASQFLFIPDALAHKPSDSYLKLEILAVELRGTWEIALRDLQIPLGLDVNQNSEITWEEVKEKSDEIAKLASAHLSVSSNGSPCTLTVEAPKQVVDKVDGTYAHLAVAIKCEQAAVQQLKIAYGLFFDFDPQHRGILQLVNSEKTSLILFSPSSSSVDLALGSTSIGMQAWQFLVEGVWHIWIGFDHILFLLALLLGSVVSTGASKDRTESAFQATIKNIIKVVTAFTVAHSITLTLAVLQIINFPSHIIESIIAASVFAAALNNIVRVVGDRQLWKIAFIFGLIHGFGFASVLVDLGLPSEALAVSLASFNVGVELGQIAIVCAFIPIAFFVKDFSWYRWVVVRGGSACVMLISIKWFFERAFSL